jgi:hypothetical protein
MGKASPSGNATKRSRKDSAQGEEVAKRCRNCHDPDSCLTRRDGHKAVFEKSSTTVAVCGVVPSCINHCICRGNPFTISSDKKSFWSACRYRSEFTVSLKKDWADYAMAGHGNQTATYSP